MTEIESLDHATWEEFLQLPVAVLILGKNECQACTDWTVQLNNWFASDIAPANVRFGKILLDAPGMSRFKLAQPWVSFVDILPFNAIFVNGDRVKEWAGGKLSRLQNQLERLLN